MPRRPVRFVHSAEFRLDWPFQGLREFPEAWRDALLDAPYQAAERVFDVALAERVDFVLLCGGLLDPNETGPRGPLFLADQFRRLAQHHIPVYWVAGAAEMSEPWSLADRLPANVTVLGTIKPDVAVLERDGGPVVRLVGQALKRRMKPRLADFRGEPGDPPTIAALYGQVEREALSERDVVYWALGGQSSRRNLVTSPRVAHDPGSPQARELNDSGPHGCTIVDLDGDAVAEQRFVPTDVIRMERARLIVTAATQLTDLQSRIREAARELLATAQGRTLLVDWQVLGHGPLWHQLRRGEQVDELVAWLRSEFGKGSAPLWTAGLRAEWEGLVPSEWSEEEGLRGDYLRQAREWETRQARDGELPALFDVASLVPRTHEDWGRLVALETRDEQQRILRQAAALGAELLSPEGTQP